MVTTLIYKRTHPGDPDVGGRFGVNNCMHSVRGWPFDAVIGVGGIGAEPRRHGLARKVNWIGIGAHKVYEPGMLDPVVTFDHFLLFGERGASGPDFAAIAPHLADRIYSRNVRTTMSFSAAEQTEVHAILALAATAPPSGVALASRPKHRSRC